MADINVTVYTTPYGIPSGSGVDSSNIDFGILGDSIGTIAQLLVQGSIIDMGTIASPSSLVIDQGNI